ncbi:TetR/AcrR family transcriptional regulator [Pseudodesulfovibrio sp.]|uniref:TetR/AcrR family transcriptional regulator n=1 Tax=unclassified Pseudodesulfovibrio TaxID=2661612 RepID=UPI003B002FE0
MEVETKTKRGRPKTMTDEARRAMIVAEAEKLFVAQGFCGTGTGQIATRCKMSKRTMYRLFPGKLELFTAVVESHRMRMMDFGDGHDSLPLDQALAKIFMIDLDQHAYEVRASFLRAANVDSLQCPELRNILRRHGGEKNRADLSAWLTRQCRNGRLVIKDVNSASQMLMDMLTGSVIFDALGGFSWGSPDERVAHFRQCIDIFLKGALPDRPVSAPSH